MRGDDPVADVGLELLDERRHALGDYGVERPGAMCHLGGDCREHLKREKEGSQKRG